MNNTFNKTTLDLWILFNLSRQAIVTVRNKELNELGVSMTAAAALRTVNKLGENATIKAISDELHFARHSVRELVIRMENIGLLTRNKKKGVREITFVEITDKGKEISLISDTDGNLEYVFSSITDEEKQELWNILTKLRERAKKISTGNLRDLSQR